MISRAHARTCECIAEVDMNPHLDAPSFLVTLFTFPIDGALLSLVISSRPWSGCDDVPRAERIVSV